MLQATLLPEIKQKSIQDAIKLLNASGCQYKILAPDGKEYGTLEVLSPQKRKKNPDRPFGALAKHFDQFTKYDAQIGDFFSVPCGPYKPKDIQSGLCAKLSKTWGAETYTTTCTPDSVQVLRTA